MKQALFAFFILALCSCDPERRHIADAPRSNPVTYSIVSRSALFTDKHISFTLDSMSSTLYIHLSINELKHSLFPVSKQFKDTLFKTVFNFDFYSNGKLITSDYKNLHNTGWERDTSATGDFLSISTDTMRMNQPQSISIQVPFYAFHNLKRGKQTIELSMWQNLFTEEVEKVKNGRSEYVHVYETKPLLNARIKFELEIPAIYKSIVYGYGLELRNDSTFSPAGMDHTLWNSSYPDIYWMLYYPTNMFYSQTPYEKSTDRYVAHDTFNLYHYYANDSIGIGVFDHDGLSDDDGMGFWTGTLERLSKHPVNRISFGYVKSFDVKVEKKGMVN